MLNLSRENEKYLPILVPRVVRCQSYTSPDPKKLTIFHSKGNQDVQKSFRRRRSFHRSPGIPFWGRKIEEVSYLRPKDIPNSPRFHYSVGRSILSPLLYLRIHEEFLVEWTYILWWRSLKTSKVPYLVRRKRVTTESWVKRV